MEKLVASVGAHLDAKDAAQVVVRETSVGSGLLALDSDAIWWARQHGVTATTFADWISSDRLVEARRAAGVLQERWLDRSKPYFTADDLHFPTFDREAMRYLWQEVAIADTYARSFEKAGISRLVTFEWDPPKPSVHSQLSDIAPSLWAERLAVSRHRHPRDLIASIRSVVDPLRHDVHHWLPVRRDAVRGRVALILNPWESHRLTAFARYMHDSLEGETVAVVQGELPKVLKRMAHDLSVPVLPAPRAKRVSSSHEVAKRFLSELEDLEKAWPSMTKPLLHHFSYYCRHRWPRQLEAIRSWEALWRADPPAAVVTSSLADAESQLPVIAAQRCGIRTFSLPHAAAVPGHGQADTDYHVCAVPYQEEAYVRNGVPRDRVLVSEAVLWEEEYPTARRKTERSSAETVILVLTDPVHRTGRLMPLVDPMTQRAGLDAIVETDGLLSGLEFRIKLHPRGHDLGWYKAAPSPIPEKVLPLDSDLHDELSRADVVLAMNYVGSALLHAIRARKPMVFLWLDPAIRSGPRNHADLFVSAGELLVEPDALAPTIRRVKEDRRYREELIRRVTQRDEILTRPNVGPEGDSFIEHLGSLVRGSRHDV